MLHLYPAKIDEDECSQWGCIIKPRYWKDIELEKNIFLETIKFAKLDKAKLSINLGQFQITITLRSGCICC